MASSKALLFFSFSLILLWLLLACDAASFNDHHHHGHGFHQNETASPFEFLRHLKGCHKGDHVKGILELKKYLHQFGYLNYDRNNTHKNDDDFDDLLEAAIKTYQKYYHIKANGIMDEMTIARMSSPRCGIPDIINGSTWMTSGNKRGNRGNHFFHTVSHFSFFNGNPKWPPSKFHLTYGFLPGTPSTATAAVTRAFRTWAGNTHFTFSVAQSYQNADLKISFGRRDHGDGFPFDGRGGTLAHAFPPIDGRFHYDADDLWAVGAVAGHFDLETVALHEIGHLLGLMHSSVEGAIMFPTIAAGTTRSLHADDIAGIRALYSV